MLTCDVLQNSIMNVGLLVHEVRYPLSACTLCEMNSYNEATQANSINHNECAIGTFTCMFMMLIIVYVQECYVFAIFYASLHTHFAQQSQSAHWILQLITPLHLLPPPGSDRCC